MKSVFVSLYMMAAMAIAVMAGRSLWASQDLLSWGGVLLVTVPFLAVLSWLALVRKAARTSARFPVVTALGAIGVAMAIWGYRRGGNIEAPMLAIAAGAGFLAYSYWYSSFNRQANDRLRVGAALPDFELTGISGQAVRSSSFADRPTIWIFHRGNWCPFCMAQIRELAGQYQELQAQGVRIALISPQPHKNTISLARKFDVPFEFLTDEGNRAARLLGIQHPFGIPLGVQMLGYDSETVLPTVIITDAGGKILWAHETDNYRIRPEPDVYLDVLRDKQAIAPAMRLQE